MNMGKRLSDASLAKIASLENRLSGALKPVTPRKEFVYGLGQRIQASGRPTLVNQMTNWHIYAMLAAGVVSMAVFVGLIVRAIIDSVAKKRVA